MRRLPKGRKCRVCGKRRYATSEAAMIVVERASERRKEKRAYYAHGWWHVTSMPGREVYYEQEQPSPEVPEMREEHKQRGTGV